MEITEIDTQLVRARGATGERESSVNHWHFCIVRVQTDEGITGVGEATAPGMERATEMAVHDLGRHVVGRDPRNVEGHWDRMYNGYAWNWGPVSLTALSGIEMALWDLLGKYHDARVCDLLGGPQRERVKVYANGAWKSEGTPEEFAEKVAERRDAGYDVVKFDPFYHEGERAIPTGKQRELAEERLTAVRDRVGDDVELGIEAHGVMSPQWAVECAKLVEPFDPLFFEEPVPPENPDAMRRVRDRVNVPIATGERLLTTFDYRDLFQHPTPADLVQPDVNNCGGISQLKKIASMAYNEYVPVAPHNSRGPVATAAAAHAAATIPNFFILEYFPDSPRWRQDLVETPEVVEDGYYHLPESPGLGVELDQDALDEYPFEKPDRTEVTYSNSYRDIWS
jgi:galactonate dehydratase